MFKPKLLFWSFLITLTLMALSAFWVGKGVLQFRNLQMDMDEAIHANRGLDISSAILRADIPDLWRHLVKPEWYPPGHGIGLGGWFLIAGASTLSARLYSTIYYFFLGLILWLSVRQIIPLANPFVYLVAPLFLISDRLFTVHSGLAMLELPAMTFSLLALLFLNLAWRERRLLWHLLAVLAGLFSLFTKYNYGLVTLAVLALLEGIMSWRELKSQESRSVAKKTGTLYVFALLILIIWFVALGHWRWMFAYSAAQPEQYSLTSFENLSYYPRFLWGESLNWLAVLFSLAAYLLLAFQKRFIVGLIPYVTFFLLSLVMLTFELQKIPRFGMILLPPLWVTGAVGAELVFQRIRPDWLRWAGYAFLLCGMLFAGAGNSLAFQDNLSREYEIANEEVDNAYKFIASTLSVSQQKKLNIVMLGRTDQWNGPALRFFLESQCISKEPRCRVTVVDTREARFGWPPQDFSEEEQKQRLTEALEEADHLILFSEKPEYPEGWELISEDQFVFKRRYHSPEQVKVLIFRKSEP